eukprot:scaffold26860_cov37-Tisochrysis_lutea.AAC.4
MAALARGLALKCMSERALATETTPIGWQPLCLSSPVQNDVSQSTRHVQAPSEHGCRANGDTSQSYCDRGVMISRRK